MAISETSNGQIMSMARTSLENHWGVSVGVTAAFFGVNILLGGIPILGSLIAILITGALNLCLFSFFLSLVRGENLKFEDFFRGFKKFGAALAVYFLSTLFIFLWSLLFIIPGIMAAFSYAMTYFILQDHPDLGAIEIIKQSKEMMRGNRLKLFYLFCRFIGWFLLCFLTLGIGFLWFIPYVSTSLSYFYEDLLKSQK